MVLRTPGGSFVRKTLLYGGSPSESSTNLTKQASLASGAGDSAPSSASVSPPVAPPMSRDVSGSPYHRGMFRSTSATYSFGSFCSVVTEFSSITPPISSPRQLPRVMPCKRTWGDDVVRFVVISDTHCRHDGLLGSLPPGDVLIHAGDFTSTGATPQVESFRDFLKRCPHECKVVIAGNHDITMHEEYYETVGEERFHKGRRDGPYFPAQCKRLLTGLRESHNVRYLDNSETEIKGQGEGERQRPLRVWGSPWTPYYQNWAFNYPVGGEEGRAIWGACPEGLDVLITHGPPLGVGDRTVRNVSAGCADLLKEVRERIRPRVHIFGHIHEGYGVYEDRDLGITYINASTSTVQYRASNAPLVFDLPLDNSQPLRWVSEVGITQLRAAADGTYVAEKEGSDDAERGPTEASSALRGPRALPAPIQAPRLARIHPPRAPHPSATPPLASPVSHCSSSSSLSSLAMSGSWCGDETILVSLMSASNLSIQAPLSAAQQPLSASAPVTPRENGPLSPLREDEDGNGHLHTHHRDEPPSPVHIATVGAT